MRLMPTINEINTLPQARHKFQGIVTETEFQVTLATEMLNENQGNGSKRVAEQFSLITELKIKVGHITENITNSRFSVFSREIYHLSSAECICVSV